MKIKSHICIDCRMCPITMSDKCFDDFKSKYGFGCNYVPVEAILPAGLELKPLPKS